MKAYKYTKKEFADGFVNHGIIKVGTMHEYKKTEHAEIGDAGEGTKIISTSVRNLEINNATQSNLPYAAKGVLRIGENAKIGKLVYSGGVNTRVDYPDAYIYCVSETASKSAMDGFGDVCIEISDINKFCTIIGLHLLEAGLICYEVFFSKCQYDGRKVIDNNFNGVVNAIDINFYFRKDPIHFHQQEYRYVYLPSISPPYITPDKIEPVVLTCPQLVGLCKIIDL